MLALLVFGWVVCGIVGYGLCLGDFTEEFPYMKHAGFSWGVALTGPFGVGAGIVCNLIHHGKLCFRLKPLTKEQRWEEFSKSGFAILGRDFFESEHG